MAVCQKSHRSGRKWNYFSLKTEVWCKIKLPGTCLFYKFKLQFYIHVHLYSVSILSYDPLQIIIGDWSYHLRLRCLNFLLKAKEGGLFAWFNLIRRTKLTQYLPQPCTFLAPFSDRERGRQFASWVTKDRRFISSRKRFEANTSLYSPHSIYTNKSLNSPPMAVPFITGPI